MVYKVLILIFFENSHLIKLSVLTQNSLYKTFLISKLREKYFWIQIQSVIIPIDTFKLKIIFTNII